MPLIEDQIPHFSGEERKEKNTEQNQLTSTSSLSLSSFVNGVRTGTRNRAFSGARYFGLSEFGGFGAAWGIGGVGCPCELHNVSGCKCGLAGFIAWIFDIAAWSFNLIFRLLANIATWACTIAGNIGKALKLCYRKLAEFSFELEYLIVESLYQIRDISENGLHWLKERLNDVFRGIGEWIRRLTTSLVMLVDRLKDEFELVSLEIEYFILQCVDFLRDSSGRCLRWLARQFGEIVRSINEYLREQAQILADWYEIISTDLEYFILDCLDEIATFFAESWRSFREFAGSVGEYVWESLCNFMEIVGHILTQAFGDIEYYIRNRIDDLCDFGPVFSAGILRCVLHLGQVIHDVIQNLSNIADILATEFESSLGDFEYYLYDRIDNFRDFGGVALNCFVSNIGRIVVGLSWLSEELLNRSTTIIDRIAFEFEDRFGDLEYFLLDRLDDCRDFGFISINAVRRSLNWILEWIVCSTRTLTEYLAHGLENRLGNFEYYMLDRLDDVLDLGPICLRIIQRNLGKIVDSINYLLNTLVIGTRTTIETLYNILGSLEHFMSYCFEEFQVFGANVFSQLRRILANIIGNMSSIFEAIFRNLRTLKESFINAIEVNLGNLEYHLLDRLDDLHDFSDCILTTTVLVYHKIKDSLHGFIWGLVQRIIELVRDLRRRFIPRLDDLEYFVLDQIDKLRDLASELPNIFFRAIRFTSVVAVKLGLFLAWLVTCVSGRIVNFISKVSNLISRLINELTFRLRSLLFGVPESLNLDFSTFENFEELRGYQESITLESRTDITWDEWTLFQRIGELRRGMSELLEETYNRVSDSLLDLEYSILLNIDALQDLANAMCRTLMQLAKYMHKLATGLGEILWHLAEDLRDSLVESFIDLEYYALEGLDQLQDLRTETQRVNVETSEWTVGQGNAVSAGLNVVQDILNRVHTTFATELINLEYHCLESIDAIQDKLSRIWSKFKDFLNCVGSSVIELGSIIRRIVGYLWAWITESFEDFEYYLSQWLQNLRHVQAPITSEIELTESLGMTRGEETGLVAALRRIIDIRTNTFSWLSAVQTDLEYFILDTLDWLRDLCAVGWTQLTTAVRFFTQSLIELVTEVVRSVGSLVGNLTITLVEILRDIQYYTMDRFDQFNDVIANRPNLLPYLRQSTWLLGSLVDNIQAILGSFAEKYLEFEYYMVNQINNLRDTVAEGLTILRGGFLMVGHYMYVLPTDFSIALARTLGTLVGSEIVTNTSYNLEGCWDFEAFNSFKKYISYILARCLNGLVERLSAFEYFNIQTVLVRDVNALINGLSIILVHLHNYTLDLVDDARIFVQESLDHLASDLARVREFIERNLYSLKESASNGLKIFFRGLANIIAYVGNYILVKLEEIRYIVSESLDCLTFIFNREKLTEVKQILRGMIEFLGNSLLLKMYDFEYYVLNWFDGFKHFVKEKIHVTISFLYFLIQSLQDAIDYMVRKISSASFIISRCTRDHCFDLEYFLLDRFDDLGDIWSNLKIRLENVNTTLNKTVNRYADSFEDWRKNTNTQAKGKTLSKKKQKTLKLTKKDVKEERIEYEDNGQFAENLVDRIAGSLIGIAGCIHVVASRISELAQSLSNDLEINLRRVANDLSAFKNYISNSTINLKESESKRLKKLEKRLGVLAGNVTEFAGIVTIAFVGCLNNTSESLVYTESSISRTLDEFYLRFVQFVENANENKWINLCVLAESLIKLSKNIVQIATSLTVGIAVSLKTLAISLSSLESPILAFADELKFLASDRLRLLAGGLSFLSESVQNLVWSLENILRRCLSRLYESLARLACYILESLDEHKNDFNDFGDLQRILCFIVTGILRGIAGGLSVLAIRIKELAERVIERISSNLRYLSENIANLGQHILTSLEEIWDFKIFFAGRESIRAIARGVIELSVSLRNLSENLVCGFESPLSSLAVNIKKLGKYISDNLGDLCKIDEEDREALPAFYLPRCHTWFSYVGPAIGILILAFMLNRLFWPSKDSICERHTSLIPSVEKIKQAGTCNLFKKVRDICVWYSTKENEEKENWYNEILKIKDEIISSQNKRQERDVIKQKGESKGWFSLWKKSEEPCRKDKPGEKIDSSWFGTSKKQQENERDARGWFGAKVEKDECKESWFGASKKEDKTEESGSWFKSRKEKEGDLSSWYCKDTKDAVDDKEDDTLDCTCDDT